MDLLHMISSIKGGGTPSFCTLSSIRSRSRIVTRVSSQNRSDSHRAQPIKPGTAEEKWGISWLVMSGHVERAVFGAPILYT